MADQHNIEHELAELKQRVAELERAVNELKQQQSGSQGYGTAGQQTPKR